MRVAIADDNPFERHALARALRQDGIEVDDDDSGASVAIIEIECFRATFPRFSRRCPVFVLTGSEQREHAAAALKAGACGVLLRDGPLDDIVAKVRSALNQT